MAARKTTADRLQDEIDRLKSRAQSFALRRNARIEELENEYNASVSAIDVQLAALYEAKAKLEQKP